MEVHVNYNFFKTELDYISNSLTREFTEKVILSVADEFFAEAASSTGKYHPEYSLGFGGLYRHTQAAVKIANSLLNLEQYKNKFDAPRRDYIIAALILHDTCKRGVGFEDTYTKFEHPILVRKLCMTKVMPIITADEKIAFGYFIDKVCELIESHMGEWNTSKYSTIVLQKPETEAQQFVHMCDYLASRKWLEVKINSED